MAKWAENNGYSSRITQFVNSNDLVPRILMMDKEATELAKQVWTAATESKMGQKAGNYAYEFIKNVACDWGSVPACIQAGMPPATCKWACQWALDLSKYVTKWAVNSAAKSVLDWEHGGRAVFLTKSGKVFSTGGDLGVQDGHMRKVLGKDADMGEMFTDHNLDNYRRFLLAQAETQSARSSKKSTHDEL